MTATRARRRARCAVVGVLSGCGLACLVAGAGGPARLAGAATRSAASLGTVVIATPGAGYAVSSQGPLDATRFASTLPDPAAAEAALSTLSGPGATYQRAWLADGGRNEVQDLLVRFPDVVGAQVFLRAVRHGSDSGPIVSADPLASIPGARRVTYFAADDQNGVGEAVTMRAGLYVDILSFLSLAGGDAHPVSPAGTAKVARAQYAAMVAAPGGAATATGVTGTKQGASAGTIGLAVLVGAVLAAAVATPAFLRRRRGAAGTPTSAAAARPGDRSDGDAVDDLHEHSG